MEDSLKNSSGVQNYLGFSSGKKSNTLEEAIEVDEAERDQVSKKLKSPQVAE